MVLFFTCLYKNNNQRRKILLCQLWLLDGCRVKNVDIFCGLGKNHKITEVIENIPLKEYNIIIMYDSV